jgi:hypothetical protein
VKVAGIQMEAGVIQESRVRRGLSCRGRRKGEDDTSTEYSNAFQHIRPRPHTEAHIRSRQFCCQGPYCLTQISFMTCCTRVLDGVDLLGHAAQSTEHRTLDYSDAG